MLTDEDVIDDLAKLRERGADLAYAGEIPLTRRSAAATIAPVAALAAVATVGASALTGSDDHAPAVQAGPSSTVTDAGAPSDPPTTEAPAVKLVDAKITLAGKVITYTHPVGEDPFAPGWQLAVVFGDGLPADATEFTVTDGSTVWVVDSPSGEQGRSVLVGAHWSAEDGSGDPLYAGLASEWSRADLEQWVESELKGVRS